MREFLISIIIPVYNTPEEYLRQCIESVLNQSFEDYEIILVDDGSTDNSGEICDEYSSCYDKISVIHKENGGLSDARNVGINNATGKYILFVDSDDFIARDSLTKIACELRVGENIDVMFLEAYKYFTEKNKSITLGDAYIKDCINGKSKYEVLEHLGKLPKYPSSAATKVILKQLIVEKKLFFINGMINEDLYWTMQVLTKAEKFWYCNTPYYFYRQNRVGSITNTFNLKAFEDLFNFVKMHSAKDLKELNEYREMVYSFAGFFFPILLTKYDMLDRKTKLKYRNEIKKFAFTMDYRCDKKTKIVKLWYNVFGVNVTGRVLRLFLKIRSNMMLG